MKKEDFEKCISDLPPELQEKARACKSEKEIYELIAESDVELNDDALEAVAGGCFNRQGKRKKDQAQCKDCKEFRQRSLLLLQTISAEKAENNRPYHLYAAMR